MDPDDHDIELAWREWSGRHGHATFGPQFAFFAAGYRIGWDAAERRPPPEAA